MNIDVNGLIFIGFLFTNLVFGLYSSRGVINIRGYAIGNKDFDTATLVSTIVATWVSGQFFFTFLSESYSHGISFIWAAVLGDFLCLLLIGKVFAPRMLEFLGTLSIAEAMGDLFGKNVRIITAISGVIGVVGIIAVQLKIAGVVFGYALGIDGIYGVIAAGTIISLYSSLGGVKSVTLTDVVQFITFGVMIPALSHFLFAGINNNQVILDTLNNNPSFNYQECFDFSSSSIYYSIVLFLFCVIPSFNPAIFQRIAMAKDIQQVRHSFSISSIVCLLLAAIISWIGILVLSIHPNANEDEIFRFIIANPAWVIGFKGFLLSGVMAMIMSTVDSYINSSAVLLIHDLQKSLNIKFIKNELFTTRLCAMFIGVAAIGFTMLSGSFLELFIFANMFFMPVVSVPFIMAIFGFRSSGKSVLLGMAAGFIISMFGELYGDFFAVTEEIGGLVPGMLANLVVLMGAHYALKQPGGWVGIKEMGPLLELRAKRKKRFNKLVQDIMEFDLIKTFKKNTPRSDGFIALIGLFIMISGFSGIATLPKQIRENDIFLLDICYLITLAMSTILITYPLWLQRWKESNALPVLWNVIIFFAMICFSFFNVLIGDFAEMPMMIFMINIVVVSSLVSWRLALFFIVFGVMVTLCGYNFYTPIYSAENVVTSLEFKVMYLLLLLSSVLIIFLKPKQEYLAETEEKISILNKEVTHFSYEKQHLEEEKKSLADVNQHLAHEKYHLAEKNRYLEAKKENLEEKNQHLEHEVHDLNKKVDHFSERVVDQQKEIDRLGATAQKILNNVNHELRLPVGNVMNFAEMLHEGLGKFNEIQLKTLSDEVYKNSNRLSTMILNMLDLATLDVKKIHLQKKMINFSEMVENRVRECRKIYLDKKPIDFKLSIEPEILISVDPNYIRQVIDNLVINAIKFSQNGVIDVHVDRQKKGAMFTINDQGMGISQTEIYDIFTPFKMGSNTESKAEGRGVGLALCKSALEAHGGSIVVESEGQGATFRFVLPE